MPCRSTFGPHGETDPQRIRWRVLNRTLAPVTAKRQVAAHGQTMADGTLCNFVRSSRQRSKPLLLQPAAAAPTNLPPTAPRNCHPRSRSHLRLRYPMCTARPPATAQHPPSAVCRPPHASSTCRRHPKKGQPRANNRSPAAARPLLAAHQPNRTIAMSAPPPAMLAFRQWAWGRRAGGWTTETASGSSPPTARKYDPQPTQATLLAHRLSALCSTPPLANKRAYVAATKASSSTTRIGRNCCLSSPSCWLRRQHLPARSRSACYGRRDRSWDAGRRASLASRWREATINRVPSTVVKNFPNYVRPLL